MSARVFLSYSKADEGVAHAVAKALEERNVSAWLDDAQLQAGVSWRQEIFEALALADVVVAILSEQSAQSPWLHFEVGAAFSVGTPVVAVLIGDTKLSDFPDWFAKLQYIDARGESLQRAAEKVTTEIMKIEAG